MKALKIISYQRNGTSGNGFYTATFTAEKEPFVASFETVEDAKADERLDVASCRVHQLTDLAEKWQGDDFGEMIQARVKSAQYKHKINSIYDLIGKAI